MTIASKLATTIFSDNSVHSHKVRFALAEKAVASDVFYVDSEAGSSDLLELNPTGMLPTLVDRDLVLMYSRIILEYLDERFPHPPLLPVYPVLRSKARLMIKHIETDWYSLFFAIENGDNVEENKKQLLNNFIKLEPLLKKNKFFMGEDFGMVDCCVAPLIWRLPSIGIDIPSKLVNFNAYSERIFERNGFQASLSNMEVKIRATEEDDF